MPFDLTNASASFQNFINDVLRQHLDEFLTIYLDDILIYSDTLTEHKIHVRRTLELLAAHSLYLKFEKCEFYQIKIEYLEFVISEKGISMNSKKIAAIKEWEQCSNLHDVRFFLGFVNFYRRFIRGYSTLATPLVNLTKKDALFIWTPTCREAFEALKTAFVTAPILARFDPDRPSLVKTDAFDYVFAEILSQYDDQGLLHPVAYFSKKHLSAECNYEIYDKKLLAIVRCFEKWRAELEESPHPIEVLSDHKNLEYFISTKLLNRRQAR
jgi:hypothetical protein